MFRNTFGVPQAVKECAVLSDGAGPAQVERVIKHQRFRGLEESRRPQGGVAVVVRSFPVVLIGPTLGDGIVVADAGVLGAVVHRIDFDLLYVFHVHRLGVEVLLFNAVHAHMDFGRALAGHGHTEFISTFSLNLGHGSQYRERRRIRIGGQGRELVLGSAELCANLPAFGVNGRGRPAYLHQGVGGTHLEDNIHALGLIAGQVDVALDISREPRHLHLQRVGALLERWNLIIALAVGIDRSCFNAGSHFFHAHLGLRHDRT